MGSFLKILSFLATLFTFIRERQLINRGKEELQKDVDEATDKATEEVKQIVSDIDALPDNAVSERLQKWTRDWPQM